jgi:hypothetical protein
VDNTTTRGNKLGIKYKHGKKLDLESVFNADKISFSGDAGAFTTVSNSRNILLSYYPFERVTVSADVDHQRKTDSRPDQGISGRDVTAINITALDMGKLLKAISYTVSKQSYPGYASASSNASISTLNVSLRLTPSIMFSPSLTDSRTATIDSSSDSKRKSARLEYRPENKPISASTTREWAKNKTQQASGISSLLDSDSLSFDFQYKFSRLFDFIYRYNRTDDKSINSDNKNLLQSYRFGYNKSERTKYSIIYSTSTRSESSSITTDTLSFESDLALSKILHWRTEFSNTKYNNSKYMEQNYKGKLVETEFRAEF